MDTMIQSYMEETEDMLQKAEECIIRLEAEYSSVDINELFRIAHTIKGSSHMVGYEDIGNLMHKIEDMLDCTRKGIIPFNHNIVSLCFDGFDVVKRMLKGKVESDSEEALEEHRQDATQISSRVESLIKVKKEDKVVIAAKQEEMGMVSTLLNKEPKGRNKYYITVFIEEDAPMITPVLMMILKTIENIGALIFSSITDDHLMDYDNNIRSFDMILCTDVEEAELYTYFFLFYVEKINITNLNRNISEKNDYYFCEPEFATYVTILKVIMKLYHYITRQYNDNKVSKEEVLIINQLQRETIDAVSRFRSKEKSSVYSKEFNRLFNLIKKLPNGKGKSNEKVTMNQGRLIKLIDKLYNEVKGKYIVRINRPEQDDFIDRLKSFLGTIKKSTTLIILIDISNLNILHEQEIKDLIETSVYLQDQGIEIRLIATRPVSRRIINIFDSIKEVYDFHVFPSELDAILDIFYEPESFHRIMEKIGSYGLHKI